MMLYRTCEYVVLVFWHDGMMHDACDATTMTLSLISRYDRPDAENMKIYEKNARTWDYSSSDVFCRHGIRRYHHIYFPLVQVQSTKYLTTSM